jgi:lipopolysaccharide heptosyltransferase II
MTVTAMRRLDRLLGVPLCWIMGLVLRAGSGRREIRDPQRILVMKFFGLGSVLLTTAVLRQVRTDRPGVHITYVTFATNGELVLRSGVADEVLLLDQSSPARFVLDTIRTIVALRRSTFDAVVDFEFFSKFSTLLGAISGAPLRGGFELPTRWRSMILTHSVPIDKHHHVIHSFSSLVSAVSGSHASPVSPVMGTDGEIRRAVKRKLGGFPGRMIVLNVNAGATFRERRWAPDRFSRVVDLLAEKEGFTFAFVGSADEREYVQSVIDHSHRRERCLNLAGALTIGEFPELLRESISFISNDSGPLHIAAAVGTPIVALYGPESPLFYGPLSENAEVIYKNIPCSPCMNVYNAKQFHCPYNAKCMDEISVEDVIDAFTTITAAR